LPEDSEPTGLERQLERLTAELKRVGEAFRHNPDRQGPPRYRNPHDHIGEYDRLDRKEPLVLDLPHFILHLPGLRHRTRRVPGRAIAEFGEDDDGEFALIECPCGSRPIVRGTIEKCACERYYLLTGRGPIVVYGEMEPPS
jgi:hypothetical protein